jgi:hypothetical protein
MLRKTITIICFMTMFASTSFPVAQAKHSDDRPGFFHRHKRLKKVLLIGGVGAATGGVGAVLLGHSVAAGAATGAGTRLGMHAAKEKYKEHKNRKP